MLFDVYFKEDKAFVDKYRKQIFSAKNLSDFEFKGYPFVASIQGTVDPMLTKLTAKSEAQKHGATINWSEPNDIDANNKEVDKNEEDYEDNFEAFRGEVLDKKGSKYTDAEFKKELRDMLHGADEKEDLDKAHLDPSAAVNRLVGSKDRRKELKDLFKSSKKTIDDGIKEVEAVERAASKFDKDTDNNKKQANKLKNVNHMLRWMRDTRSLLATIDGIALNTLKEASRQDKQMLVAIMRYSPKKEGFSEGGSMNWEHEDETARSFLGSINLV
jgi:hypothetical protein